MKFNRLILEINSFANPFPFQEVTIKSFVLEFLEETGNDSYIEMILEHDRNNFDTPSQWQKKSIKDSPLVSDFDNIWLKLRLKYRTELSAYAYRPIPEEDKVAHIFRSIMQSINEN